MEPKRFLISRFVNLQEQQTSSSSTYASPIPSFVRSFLFFVYSTSKRLLPSPRRRSNSQSVQLLAALASFKYPPSFNHAILIQKGFRVFTDWEQFRRISYALLDYYDGIISESTFLTKRLPLYPGNPVWLPLSIEED